MQYLDDGQLDNPYSGRVSSGNYTEVVTTKDACRLGNACAYRHTYRTYRLFLRGFLCPKGCQRARGTQEFIPDGDLLPLPHTRTQLCHYALRLTQPVSAQNSAAWSRFKQLVSYGFEPLDTAERGMGSLRTEFHFRVYHRTKECWVGEWCEPAGADGFAFVIQNEGRKIVGAWTHFSNSLRNEVDSRLKRT